MIRTKHIRGKQSTRNENEKGGVFVQLAILQACFEAPVRPQHATVAGTASESLYGTSQ